MYLFFNTIDLIKLHLYILICKELFNLNHIVISQLFFIYLKYFKLIISLN